MFRHFQIGHGFMFALIILLAALAFLWEPATELIGRYEMDRINQRAEREGWVGQYPLDYAPVDVKRVE